MDDNQLYVIRCIIKVEEILTFIYPIIYIIHVKCRKAEFY